MIVVSDTSPLCYLILLREIQMLPTLFGTVQAPELGNRYEARWAAPPSGQNSKSSSGRQKSKSATSTVSSDR